MPEQLSLQNSYASNKMLPISAMGLDQEPELSSYKCIKFSKHYIFQFGKLHVH
jgi:hypothetical protein